MPCTPRMRLIGLLLCGGCAGAAPEHEAAPAGDASAWCPALRGEPSDSDGSLNASVGGEHVQTDLAAMAAALPETHAGWHRTQVTSMPRGAAGHWSPVVLARYVSGEAEALLEVTDLVHVCTCAVGMGAALRDARGGEAVAPGPDIAGYPVFIAATPPSVELWVNDRCSLRVHGAVSATDMTSLVEGVDYAALRAACPARDGR